MLHKLFCCCSQYYSERRKFRQARLEKLVIENTDGYDRDHEACHSKAISVGLSPAMREKLGLEPLTNDDIGDSSDEGETETLYEKVTRFSLEIFGTH